MLIIMRDEKGVYALDCLYLRGGELFALRAALCRFKPRQHEQQLQHLNADIAVADRVGNSVQLGKDMLYSRVSPDDRERALMRAISTASSSSTFSISTVIAEKSMVTVMP